MLTASARTPAFLALSSPVPRCDPILPTATPLHTATRLRNKPLSLKATATGPSPANHAALRYYITSTALRAGMSI